MKNPRSTTEYPVNFITSFRKYKQLSAEEQFQLSEIVYDFTKHTHQHKTFDLDYLKKVEGDDIQIKYNKYLVARKSLVLCNIPLVISLAQKVCKNSDYLNDYVQEGIIGLHIAIDRYDYSLGNKITTYAYFWIMHRIYRCGVDDNLVVVPIEVRNKLRKLKKIKSEHNSTQNLDEKIKSLKISKNVWKELVNNKLVIDRQISLDITISTSEGKSSSINDTIEDEDSVSPTEYAIKEELKTFVRDLLLELPELDREIVKGYYGIDCEITGTAELSIRHNIPRRAISDILNRSKKLIKIKAERKNLKFLWQ